MPTITAHVESDEKPENTKINALNSGGFRLCLSYSRVRKRNRTTASVWMGKGSGENCSRVLASGVGSDAAHTQRHTLAPALIIGLTA